jgi:hypothetical protein
VRKYAFYYRYDTPEERAVLNRLWPLGNDRLNYLTPTIKPIGYASTTDGRRRRLYDAPHTPLERLLAAGTLSRAQQAELITYRDSLNPPRLDARSPTCRTDSSSWPRKKPNSSICPRSPQHCPTSAKASGPRPADPPFRGHSYLRHRSIFAGILI